MTAAFTITPVEKGILRCKHTSDFTSEDVRSLADFFHDYNGKLLVDLTSISAEECATYLKRFRPMMPTAAIFGTELDPTILEIPESYYANPVQYFRTEQEALTWLREQ